MTGTIMVCLRAITLIDAALFKAITRENCVKVYFILAIVGVSLCLYPSLIEKEACPAGSAIFEAIRASHYNYSLVAQIAISIPRLLHILTDIIFSSKVMMGTTFNLLLLLAVVIPSMLGFFYAVPTSNCQLLVSLFYVKLVTSYSVMQAFIAYNDGTVFCSPVSLLGAAMYVSGSVTQVYSLTRGYGTDDHFDSTGRIIQITSFIVTLWTSIRWLYQNRKILFSKHMSLNTYSCCAYLAGLWMYVLSILILDYVCPYKHWYDKSAVLLAGQVYTVAAIIVILLICHGRAARVELVTSKIQYELDMKKLFTRFISHEMRTPINTFLAGLEYLERELRQGSISFGEVLQTVLDLQTCCGQSKETLDQLLIYDSIDSGLQKLYKSEFAILPFIQDTVQQFSLQAREGSINLTVDVSDDCIAVLRGSTLHADRNKLTVVMRNLLSNALKFSKSAAKRNSSPAKIAPSMTVCVLVDVVEAATATVVDRGAALPSCLRIRVVDSGVGISKENLPRLFQEAVQFSPEKLQAGGGSGLGLWISKKFVDMHGGSLTASSEGEGHGCTFSLQIPMQSSREHNDESKNSSSNNNRGNNNSNDVESGEIGAILSPTELFRRNDVFEDGDVDASEAAADGPVNNREETVSPLVHEEGDVSQGFGSRPDLAVIDGGLRSFHVALNGLGDTDIEAPPVAEDMGGVTAASTTGVGVRVGVGEELRTSVGEVSAREPSTSTLVPSAPPPDTSRLRSVLVVDDAGLNRKYVVKLLKGTADVILEAEDGLEAVEMVRESMTNHCPFEVIFMDFVMPNMDGPTATRTIRAMGFQGVILGVTGNVTEEDVAHFIAHGANDVAPKPLNMAKLRSLLQKHLNQTGQA